VFRWGMACYIWKVSLSRGGRGVISFEEEAARVVWVSTFWGRAVGLPERGMALSKNGLSF